MKASQFLDSEKAALLEIKSLLTEGENSQFRTSGKRLDEQLENLIKPREYL